MPDIVYRLRRQGRAYHELRYSLRSLKNVPHDKVWIVGTTVPSWATGLHQIVPPWERATKWRNIAHALLLAACNPGVADEFILFDDDMIAMQPMDRVPVLHRGPLPTKDELKSQGTYQRGYPEAARVLQMLEVPEPYLNYELHVPLPMERDAAAAILGEATTREPELHPRIRCFHSRTIYANAAGIGGEFLTDAKVIGDKMPKDWESRLFLSTNEYAFERYPIGRIIRDTFPDPGPYERQS